jgi:AraC-like DNA-binding protein
MTNQGIRDYRQQHRQGVLLLSAAALRTISQPWLLVPHKKIGFSATVQTWFFQRLLLARAQGDGTIMYRTQDHLGDGYDKYVLMVLLHEGGLTCTQAGRTTTAGRGDIVTLLPRETYESNALDGTDATMLYVPIDYLESRGLSPDRLAASSWPGGPLLDGILALVESTLDLAEDDAAGQSPHIEQALLELLVGLLRRYLEGLGEPDAAAEQLRSRVLGLIAVNYANPGYGVDAIAAELGASRRFVYKLFEGRGVSVASLLRSQRLDAAESLLRSLGREATLSRIARATGFTSAESFSRAFKESRGVAPSAFRARYFA